MLIGLLPLLKLDKYYHTLKVIVTVVLFVKSFIYLFVFVEKIKLKVNYKFNQFFFFWKVVKKEKDG